jgi:hypothetical protein
MAVVEEEEEKLSNMEELAKLIGVGWLDTYTVQGEEISIEFEADYL